MKNSRIKDIVGNRLEELPEDVRRLMEGVLWEFDFFKVWRAMVMLDSGWYMEGGRYGIPSIEEIVENSIRLMIMATEDLGESKTVGSGGFEVRYDHEYLSLELSFIIQYVYNSLKD